MAIDLSALNDAQRAAVLDTEGAILVFAGAGSGKTRTLTHRVCHLISEKNVPGWSILAITFTNKAADEMKARINKMLGEEKNEVWVSTFHSFCANVLFRNAERIGFSKNFSILDESGATRMVRRIIREKHLNEKDKDKIRGHISAAKNAGLSADEYCKKLGFTREAILMSECIERYDELLKENNAMDFDDLQVEALRLFKENPDVAEKYSRRFRYIHVDEFQDTNDVQLELVQILCAHWKNIFVVGDDDQSIYSWRGANVQNIINFGAHFENVKIHKLMQNYRSTGAILEAANNVIKHNETRQEKQLFTTESKGVKVEYKTAQNEYDEAKWVTDNIRNLIRYNNYSQSDFAILTRVNAFSRLYEMKLRDLGYDYTVLGGFRFFERQEILDVVAYLKMLCNPADSDSIVRIINFPARNIGDATVEKLLEYCREKKLRLFDVILDINENNELTNAIKNKVAVFKEILDDLIIKKSELPLDEFVEYLIDKVGFRFAYTSANKEDDMNRWENIKEFVTYVKEFTEKNEENSLEEFLRTVTLNTEKRADSGANDMVTIATMHSAKGLEFRVVFIIGCEEGRFPSERSMKENMIEEERRVMYVAITRAKERLYISCAENRKSYGGGSKLPSRFYYEAKDEEPQADKEKAVGDKIEKYYEEKSWKNVGYDEAMPLSPRKISPVITRKPVIFEEKKVYNSDTDGFEKGKRVNHVRYGEGIIIDVNGSGAGKTATVLFKMLGAKKFALANAPLTLL